MSQGCGPAKNERKLRAAGMEKGVQVMVMEGCM
jgi:hypothetical protein